MAQKCPKCGRVNSGPSAKCIYCGQALEPEASGDPGTKPAQPAAKLAGAVSRERVFLVVPPLNAEPEPGMISALAALMGWERYLARAKLKSLVPYILAGSEDPQKLQDLKAGLSGLGLEVFLIKETGLARLEAKQLAYSAVKEQDRIIFRLEDDSEKPVPFSELFLLVRGRIRLGFALSRKLGKVELPDMDLGREKYFDQIIKSRRDRKRRKSPVVSPEEAETGTEMEIFDLYCRHEHQALRVIESEFDFSGLFGPGFGSRLLGVRKLIDLLRSSAQEMTVDETFIKTGYAYRDSPADDPQSRNFARDGQAKSRSKLHSIQATFTEHSGMSYLYHLQKKTGAGK